MIKEVLVDSNITDKGANKLVGLKYCNLNIFGDY